MSSLLQKATKCLHAQGGRVTQQRRLILETLEEMIGQEHPTAEELHRVVQQSDPNIHLSTVYRTLRWLQQEGIVTGRLFTEENRHERFDPALPSEHHHFICTRCNKVIEFNDALISEIKNHFAIKTGNQVASASLSLYGLCQDCRARSQAPSS